MYNKAKVQNMQRDPHRCGRPMFSEQKLWLFYTAGTTPWADGRFLAISTVLSHVASSVYVTSQRLVLTMWGRYTRWTPQDQPDSLSGWAMGDTFTVLYVWFPLQRPRSAGRKADAAQNSNTSIWTNTGPRTVTHRSKICKQWDWKIRANFSW